MITDFKLLALTAADLDDLVAYWPAAHPLHPLHPETSEILRRRLLAPRGVDTELMLAARDANNALIGIACAVYPVKEEGIGGIRWLGTLPQWRSLGVEAALLEQLCERLAARGAGQVKLFGTPPYYIRPGIDTRETELISTLLDLGWRHDATHFNMSVDLSTWNTSQSAAQRVSGTPGSPSPSQIWDADAQGYSVRRAQSQDRPAFHDAMTIHWTHTWRDEADQAFDNDPITLFIAWRGEEIAGFAACEVSQCIGGFGPTGVMPAHRGAGLGKRLLWACLDDLKTRGRATCEIGWIGPVSFYHRACGARLGASYWGMSKDL